MSNLFTSFVRLSDDKKEDIPSYEIVLRDETTNKEAICKDLDEYQQKLEDMSLQYDDIEMKWSKSKDLPISCIYALQNDMQKLREKYIKDE